VTAALNLNCNTSPQQYFTGQMIGHSEFLVDRETRRRILDQSPSNKAVLFPYLNGDDFLSGTPTFDRYVIDFGTRDQIEAKGYSAAFRHVELNVLPSRIANAEAGKDASGKQRSHHKQFLEHWWLLSFGRPDLIARISRRKRFLVCSRVTKRPVFVFVSSSIRPGDALSCFPFDDDYTFGVIQSKLHWVWFTQKCSKLTERFRYGEAVWNTFAWPQSPAAKDVKTVAAAGREVRRIRDEALKKIKGGLRAVYRTLELPGHNPLKDAHAALDAAVLAAYGFSAKKDLLQQLLDLNLKVAARIDRNEPVTAPGIPPDFPNPKSLITEDCIHPSV